MGVWGLGIELNPMIFLFLQFFPLFLRFGEIYGKYKTFNGIELANINNWGLSFLKMGVWGFGDWFNPMIFEFDEFFHCFLILKN